MSKQLIYLVSFVFMFGLILTSSGNAAEADLVGWWKFDETSGTIAHDASGNGNDGALNGDPVWVTGKKNGALQLDGDGDYVEVGSVGISGIDTRTIAGWAKASTTAIPGGTTVFGFAPIGNTDGTYFDVAVDDSGNYGLYVGGWYFPFCAVDTQWHYFAATFTGDGGSWYLDGQYIDSEEGPLGTIDQVRIGARIEDNKFFPGIIDDVRIYNKALTLEEIIKLMAGPNAYNPVPADSTLYTDIWVNLGWLPGNTAVSHDVYFSDNFDDVNDTAGDAYRGNQTALYFLAGAPGSPYPEGLVPGTTYYWRIDEVEADGTTVHKGDIWSFTVPSKKAYFPDPADGAKFIGTDTQLSWTPGFGAKLHTVYFGDNFDDVNNAADGSPKPLLSHNPGPLEPGKTYYWRVDEFDTVDTYKGPVWSFTTAGPGGGIRGDYFRGMDLRNHALRRIDPQINFSWGQPDPSIGENNFSVRWTGEVEVAFTEKYTFYTNTDDGARLWVDGKQLVNDWNDHGAEENSGTIDLAGGQFYPIVMEYYENGGGAVAQLSWSSPSTTKQLIPQAALSPPIRAGTPNPPNKATDVKRVSILKWTAGDHAVSHQVYFGTDKDAVSNADTGSPEYKGPSTLGEEKYDPGLLEWDTTYFWRIDEVNDSDPNSPWTGNLWSFTTANFPVVDDFEVYDARNDQIWWAWKDGLGYAAHDNEPAYPGNGTGSAVGDESTASFTEETIVHGGRQSMPLSYDNNKQGYSKYSEVELTLSHPRDWTEKEPTVLSLWFHGNLSNTPERMYVAIANSTGIPVTIYHDDTNAAKTAAWTEWVIPLQSIADLGIILTDVTSIAIGLGTRGNLTIPGGSGKIYIDDIRLY
ncbi:MAG: PA14 domain-containing protein [Planctomycetota bacterium]|jgi:hypothetical protein